MQITTNLIMTFLNLDNYNKFIFNGETKRFETNSITKWINVSIFIEKPDHDIFNPEDRKAVFGKGISIFKNERLHFILTGYCEKNNYGLFFYLNKKYTYNHSTYLQTSITYQGFFKKSDDGSHKLELICDYASGVLTLDSSFISPKKFFSSLVEAPLQNSCNPGSSLPRGETPMSALSMSTGGAIRSDERSSSGPFTFSIY